MWYSNFTNPDGSGKRMVKAMDANKQTAQKMSDALEETMRATAPSSANGQGILDMSCQAFVEKAIDDHFGMTDKKETCSIFRNAMTQLQAAIPAPRVRDITPDALMAMKKAWVKSGAVQQQADGRIAGVGVCGANRRIAAIKTLMRWAEEKYSLTPQNWKSVKPWKSAGGRTLRYTKEQHAKIFAASSGGVMRTLYMLGYNVGLRPGESRWLWRENVEFYKAPVEGAHGLIHIHTKSYIDDKGRKIIWSPKSENGQYDCSRSIPMNEALAKYLMAWFAVTPGPWVLSENGKPPPTRDNISKMWNGMLKKAGIDGILYTLRHSYASDLIAGGEPIMNVQRFMGHASVKTTETYIHFAPKISTASNSLHLPPYKGTMSMAAA